MPDIEIKRGYEVLPDNNIRFGIRITNVSELAIFEVEVILDFTESLFKLEGERLQKVGVIPPASARTVEFILKPLGCVHKVNIEALISYRDAKSKKYRVDMRPKEVHCVCPFLKGKKMPRAEFLQLSSAGHSSETGLTFRGVSVERLTSFLVQTCKSRHYKVDDFSIDGGRMLYLASESIGEKAYYLLTALIKEDDGLTQVMLRAVSDKPHGLNGFLNETVADLRHVVSTVQSAQEIGVIKKEQVINIIDSVVQRSTISMGEGAPSVKIKDSMVQRTEIKGDEERKRREQEWSRREEEQRREKEEQERLRKQKEQEEKTQRERIAREEAERRERERQIARQEEERLRRQQEEQARIARGREELSAHKEPKGTSWKGLFAVALVLGVVLIGYWVLAPGATKSDFTNSIGMEFMQIPAGEFDMGLPESEKDRYSYEQPVHRVKISKAFYMGKYEVTQKQWRDVMGSNPSYFKGDNLPVESVSWNDAQEFIKKLNEKKGTNKYRLPSEAEWEYAARAGTTTKYTFGDDESELDDYAWHINNSGNKTHEVGQKKPNPWGLYDIHGNVWELVQDSWYENYKGAPTDGSAWENIVGSPRVVRGGGWYSAGFKSANRYSIDPQYGKHRAFGFRLVSDL